MRPAPQPTKHPLQVQLDELLASDLLKSIGKTSRPMLGIFGFTTCGAFEVVCKHHDAPRSYMPPPAQGYRA